MLSGHWKLGTLFAAMALLFAQACTITTGTTCGSLGQACCGGACDVGVCNTAGICQSTGSGTCGSLGNVCCAGNACSSGACSGGICVSTSGTGTVYGLCTAVGSACSSDSLCEVANHAASGASAGAFCTADCTVTNPNCPAASDGSALLCVPDEGDTSGQCYEACSGSGQCKQGFICVQSASGGAAYCAPNGGSVGTIDPAYRPCGAGEACGGGTTCAEANVTTDGFVGDFCTAPCTVNAPACPADGSNALVCVPDAASTTGECYLACATDGSCPYGLTCATEDGDVAFCVP